MKNLKTISVLGAGALGTALTIFITKSKGARVRLWDKDPAVISQIRKLRESPHLPQKKIPEEVFTSSNLKEVIKNTNLVILAVPAFAIRPAAKKLAKFKKLPPILLVSKGIEKKTYLLPSQIVEEVLKTKRILHLAWVGFAKEIDKKIPAKVILASKDIFLINSFKNIFETPWLKPEVTDDLFGVELASALKNVMAVGIGLTLSSVKNKTKREKLRSKLIFLSVKEMIELGRVMGTKKQTFWGPAGRGDLKISSYPDSRNYQLGESIYQKGIKKAKKDLEKNKKTAEGLLTAFSAFQLAKLHKLRLPIIEEVYRIIYEGKNPKLSAKKIKNLTLK